MNWRPALFALIAIAAAGSALARAPAATPKDDIDRLQQLLARKGYSVDRVEWVGDALTVIHFSSGDCRDMKVMPVSVILQESALLKNVSGEDRYFVYQQQVWKTSVKPPVELPYIKRQLLEIAHRKPQPATDTMLYFAIPQHCRAPLDWAQFWRS
jgi:hypothetical protein